MTDDVAELVLADNEAQANALAIAAVEAPMLVGAHARLMERLEQTGSLDRALEGLPNAKVLQERHAAGLGLTSPELAVLLAHTKLELQRALVDSDVPDDPELAGVLRDYFPPALRTVPAEVLASHRLHREIVATRLANDVVNRAGITFLTRLGDETGAGGAVLAAAHVVAREVFDAVASWEAIDALDLVVPAGVQNEMFLAVRRLVERGARWLVHHGGDLELRASIDRFRPGVREVLAALPGLLGPTAAAAVAAATARLREGGVPGELAASVAAADVATAALPVVAVAEARKLDPLTVGGVHFLLAERLGLESLRDRIVALPRADRWQTEARAALRDDFLDAQRALTEAVLAETDATRTGAERVDEWATAHAARVARYAQVVDDIEAGGVFELATLAVARRALRELAEPDD